MTPVVTALQHSQTVRSLSARLARLTSALRQAHLQACIVTSAGNPNAQQLSDLAAASSSSDALMDALVTQLTAPLATVLTITLPSSSTMTIRAVTALEAPTYGTVFHVLAADDPNASSVFRGMLRFDNVSKLERHVERLVAHDVTSYVARETKMWRASPTAADELRLRSGTEGKGAGLLKINTRDGQLLLLGRFVSGQTAIEERWNGGIGDDVLGQSLLEIARTAADAAADQEAAS